MKVFLSASANSELKKYIEDFGYEIEEVSSFGLVGTAVSCHPDIFYCALNKSVSAEKIKRGVLLDGNIYKGDRLLLGEKYPDDVLYNAAAVGKYLICSKYTSDELIAASGLIPVIVPQGYVKCNLVVVDDSHVITEDKGIYSVLSKIPDLECLLVSGGQVSLPGYKYGFLGGCSGRVGNTMVFNGDLSSHSDCKKIAAFINGCGLELKYFSDYPLTDIGSIIAAQS